MSSLSAMIVCYIHALGCGYLALLHFHVVAAAAVFLTMVSKEESWWLAPDFLSALLDDLTVWAQHHCFRKPRRPVHTMLSSLDIVFKCRLSRSAEPVTESPPPHYHRGQPTELQAFVSVYLCSSAPPAPRWRGQINPLKRRKKKKEAAEFHVWGHSRTQFPTWQYNTLTIWVTGPSPTVTSISRSIYQFNSFIFLITKLLSLWACAERLWLLIKMELY